MSSSTKLNVDAQAATVAAVVVTYNRKQLLAQCLEAILAQTRPVDRIILVDSCSSDGTPEFLRERGFLQNNVIEYVRLPENAGSAGGFHEGMKRAYEEGHDWLWLMDDDGMPDSSTLASLLQCPSHILFRGCVVLSTADPKREQLTFGVETPHGTVLNVKELAVAADGNSQAVFEGVATPYNGILISRIAVSRIGFPKKELFIWGDETEYFLRAKKCGIPIATVFAARFFHPPDRMLWRRIRLGPTSFVLPYSEDPSRFYLIVRNYAYICLRYRGPLSRSSLKQIAYPFLFPRLAGAVPRAWFEAVSGRLSGGKNLGRFRPRRAA